MPHCPDTPLALPPAPSLLPLSFPQLLGLAGCGRKRLLLLWAALDVVCTGGSGPAAAAAAGAAGAAGGGGLSVGGPGELGPGGPGAAVDVWGLLRLCLTAMEPPDQPGQQVCSIKLARVQEELFCKPSEQNPNH